METVHLEIVDLTLDKKKVEAYRKEPAHIEALKVASQYGLENEVDEFYIKYRESGCLPSQAYNDALFEWDL